MDQNPSGFKMTSPEATVGIRGTIVAMRREGNTTTVYVENTLRRVYVNNIDVPSGLKMVIGPGVTPSPVPIEPQDRRELGRDLAFLGGVGSAAAAPEPSTETQTAPTQALLAASTGIVPPDTGLTDIALAAQTLGDSLLAAAAVAADPMGSIRGTGDNSGANVDWGFQVNLRNGDITEGFLHYLDKYAPLQSDFTGGMGTATPSGWSFTAQGISGGAPSNLTANNPSSIDLFSAIRRTRPRLYAPWQQRGGGTEPCRHALPGRNPKSGNGQGPGHSGEPLQRVPDTRQNPGGRPV
ncbi:MAG: hypothetical protein FWF99_03115 [Desulfovibrionaceae bacterium]|nr:hypothetical protein [Desulfovibrionaceae bacterium]